MYFNVIAIPCYLFISFMIKIILYFFVSFYFKSSLNLYYYVIFLQYDPYDSKLHLFRNSIFLSTSAISKSVQKILKIKKPCYFYVTRFSYFLFHYTIFKVSFSRRMHPASYYSFHSLEESYPPVSKMTCHDSDVSYGKVHVLPHSLWNPEVPLQASS